MWIVEVRQNVYNLLSKRNTEAKKFDKIIEILKINPIPPEHSKKLRTIRRRKGKSLCEIKINKLRFYYTVKSNKVEVLDYTYDGYVDVFYGGDNHKAGNKNYPNQRKFINKIKKDFDNDLI